MVIWVKKRNIKFFDVDAGHIFHEELKHVAAEKVFHRKNGFLADHTANHYQNILDIRQKGVFIAIFSAKGLFEHYD